jgi:hypothetical protein
MNAWFFRAVMERDSNGRCICEAPKKESEVAQALDGGSCAAGCGRRRFPSWCLALASRLTSAVTLWVIRVRRSVAGPTSSVTDMYDARMQRKLALLGGCLEGCGAGNSPGCHPASSAGKSVAAHGTSCRDHGQGPQCLRARRGRPVKATRNREAEGKPPRARTLVAYLSPAFAAGGVGDAAVRRSLASGHLFLLPARSWFESARAPHGRR